MQVNDKLISDLLWADVDLMTDLNNCEANKTIDGKIISLNTESYRKLINNVVKIHALVESLKQTTMELP